jgi:hypothetical protein
MLVQAAAHSQRSFHPAPPDSLFPSSSVLCKCCLFNCCRLCHCRCCCCALQLVAGAAETFLDVAGLLKEFCIVLAPNSQHRRELVRLY